MSRSECGWPCSAAEVTAFWAATLATKDLASLVEKYAQLGALIERGPSREVLRTLARRWPGCLREVELTAPSVLARRHELACQALARAERSAAPTRASLRASGGEALALYGALHPLLANARRRGVAADLASAGDTPAATGDPREPLLAPSSTVSAPSRQPSLESMAEAEAEDELAALQAVEIPAAFGPSHAPAVHGVRLRYLWISARSGQTMARLCGVLFERAGPWDRRAGDPAWSFDEAAASRVSPQMTPARGSR